ncbi:MAG: hypothetical protein J6T23_04090 [Elusimicrobia bacterium]|nr:hypothetical protein [Elusimicrobiota bacterium]
MGLSEKAQENKTKYNMKYTKEHYKRIPLNVTFDKFEEIKLSAEKHGEKVNTYIKIAIDERLSRDNDKE